MPGPGHTVNLPSEIRESSRLKRRFSWSANVPITNDPCLCGLGGRLADVG
jgi:hypothetical protein